MFNKKRAIIQMLFVLALFIIGLIAMRSGFPSVGISLTMACVAAAPMMIINYVCNVYWARGRNSKI